MITGLYISMTVNEINKPMQIEIKNRWTGDIIFSGEFPSLKLAVEHCAVAKISLSSSDLSNANLRNASLRGSSLNCSNLSGSNLSNANLSYTDLYGSDLSDANISNTNFRGTNLSNSDLRGADLSNSVLQKTDLSCSDLNGLNLSDSFAIPHLDAKILNAIEAGGKLEMDDWHKCETTHCRAGWAVTVAGFAGAALECLYGTEAAANLIYAASRPNKKQPNFFASNEKAMADIKACAAEDPLPK